MKWLAQVDENTICVAAVLGTTFTGQMDPIKEINDLLVDIKKHERLGHTPARRRGKWRVCRTVRPIPISNGTLALEQVKSINASGHKYGLVYPGIGWLVMKDKNDLPEELVFRINLPGGGDDELLAQLL